MEYSAAVSLTNQTGVALDLWVEPWGDFAEFPPKSTIRIVGAASAPGEFDIAWAADRVIVYAWPTATVHLFSEGVELKPGAFTQPAPGIPRGMTTKVFIGLIVGG